MIKRKVLLNSTLRFAFIETEFQLARTLFTTFLGKQTLQSRLHIYHNKGYHQFLATSNEYGNQTFIVSVIGRAKHLLTKSH